MKIDVDALQEKYNKKIKANIKKHRKSMPIMIGPRRDKGDLDILDYKLNLFLKKGKYNIKNGA